LLTAVFFGIWLNAAVAETFLSPVLANPWWRVANWAILGCFWFFSFRRAAGALSQIYHGDAHYNDELFSRAQAEYLRGQWFEAESLLLRLLRDEPSDVEGRLLLATLYRHTRRPDLAQAQLDRVERMREGGRWHWEVLRERTLAEKVASVLATENSEHAAAGEIVSPGIQEAGVQKGSAADTAPASGGGLSKVA
jgi:hypothetical protein